MYQAIENPFGLSPWDAHGAGAGDDPIGTIAIWNNGTVTVPFGAETTLIDWTNAHAPVRFHRLYMRSNWGGSPTGQLYVRVDGGLKLGTPQNWLNDFEGPGSLVLFDLDVPGLSRLQLSFLNLTDSSNARPFQSVVLFGSVFRDKGVSR